MTRKLVLLSLTLALVGGVAPTAQARIKITKIRFDPPGSDHLNNHDLRAEYVVIHNTGGKRSLRGWKLRDRAGHTYRFPRFRIRAGAYVKIHTGRGRDDRNDLFWDMDTFVWNNDGGDTAKLKTRGGRLVDRCRYGPSADSPARC